MSPLNLLDELFRDEIARQTAAMKAALSALVKNQSAVTAESPIVLAAQALKGAARAAGFTVVGRLTEDLETFLDAASRVGKPLSTRDLDVIRKSIGLLEEFGVLSRPEADDLARRERKTLSELSAALTGEAAPEPRPERRPSGAFGNTLELYRLECEVHTGTLTDGLLLLEKDPSRIEEIEPLMRAAHSIKGAARVVGLDAAVRLAHAMEDHFVRVQRGELAITPEAVEVLLAGTDTLLRLAESTDEKRGATPPEDASVLSLATQVAALGTAAHGTGAADVEEPELPRAPSEPAAVEVPRPVRKEADRPLRISADRLSRLVALSSEVLVEARRLAPFLERQHRLRVKQTSLADLVNEVHQLLGAPPATDSVGARIAELRSRVSESRQHLIDWTTDFEEHSRRSEELALRLFEEASSSRMRPFGEALRAFPRMVRDVARRLGKKAELVIEGADVPVDRDILEKLDAPLNHILRNSVDHGLETPDERRQAGKPERGVIHLSARQRAGMVEILVRDDGRGLDLARIRTRILENGLATEREVEGLSEELVLDHIFAPGFSTTTEVSEISGRGVGLDVVQSVLHEVGGSVHVSSVPGAGATFHLRVPVSRSVIRAVVVRIAGEPYAFPLLRIDRLLRVPVNEVHLAEDRQFVVVEGRNVALVPADQVLELSGGAVPPGDVPVVLVSERAHRLGFAVEAFLGEVDLVVRPLDARLGRVADISSAALLGDGSPVLVLDVEDLVRSVLRRSREAGIGKAGLGKVTQQSGERRRKRILVVDDSAAVRELESELLARQGYLVVQATDGVDAWSKVRENACDLVITDVDMPRMDGIALTRSVKQDPRLRSTPVMIVSYRDSEEDRARGLAAAADFYFAKSEFGGDALLQAVVNLIGEAKA